MNVLIICLNSFSFKLSFSLNIFSTLLNDSKMLAQINKTRDVWKLKWPLCAQQPLTLYWPLSVRSVFTAAWWGVNPRKTVSSLSPFVHKISHRQCPFRLLSLRETAAAFQILQLFLIVDCTKESAACCLSQNPQQPQCLVFDSVTPSPFLMHSLCLQATLNLMHVWFMELFMWLEEFCMFKYIWLRHEVSMIDCVCVRVVNCVNT